MLAPLDNETILKKAFTDKTVFKAFVRDILGIEVDKIERGSPNLSQKLATSTSTASAAESIFCRKY